MLTNMIKMTRLKLLAGVGNVRAVAHLDCAALETLF